MFHQIFFDRPWFLLITPVAAPLLWLASVLLGVPTRTPRWITAFALRILVVAILSLVCAGPHMWRRSDTTATFFLCDVSRSIPPAQRAAELDFVNASIAAKPRNDFVGVIEFGRNAAIVKPLTTSSKRIDAFPELVSIDATNIAEASRLAESSFPEKYARRIVILSDGNENVESVEDRVSALINENVQVIVPSSIGVGARNTATAEAAVEDFYVPPHTDIGATIPIQVTTRSTVSQRATMVLQRDGTVIQTEQVKLDRGLTSFSLSDTPATAGFHRYDVTIKPEHDTISDNNTDYGFVTVRGKPRILYFSHETPDQVQPLSDALAVQGITLDPESPQTVSSDPTTLLGYDAVVFSNVDAKDFTPDQMSVIHDAVRDQGLGLGMIGGPDSFAAGNYLGTPIAQALPVAMTDRVIKRRAPIVLVMVIEDLEDNSLINMSVEAAKATLDLLRPTDRIGVLDCNGTWRIPIQSASNKPYLKSIMDQMQGMNDPDTYDAYLAQAATSLAAEKSGVKHIMFLGDGDAQPPDSALIPAIHKLGITLSTIASGADDAGIQEMAEMAQAGGGTAYVVDTPSDLPKILVRDQQAYRRELIVETPTVAHTVSSSDVTTGISWATSPPLLGYNIASAKPDAIVDLVGGTYNDPLLVHGHFGLGRTFAFTSDARLHWAQRWIPWSGYGKFWTQLMRSVERTYDDSDLHTSAHLVNGTIRVDTDIIDAAKHVTGATVSLDSVGPDGQTIHQTMHQSNAGEYVASQVPRSVGAYMLTIRASWPGQRNATETLGIAVPYSPEFRLTPPNGALLARLADETNGKVVDDPAQVYTQAPVRVTGVTDFAPPLLILAAWIFLLDIAARMLGWLIPVKKGVVRYVNLKTIEARANNRASSYSQNDINARTVEGVPTANAVMPPEPPINKKARKRSAKQDEVENPFPHVARIKKPKPKD